MDEPWEHYAQWKKVYVVYNSVTPWTVACQAPTRQPVYDLLEKANKLKGQKVCWFAKPLGNWVRGLMNKGTEEHFGSDQNVEY